MGLSWVESKHGTWITRLVTVLGRSARTSGNFVPRRPNPFIILLFAVSLLLSVVVMQGVWEEGLLWLNALLLGTRGQRGAWRQAAAWVIWSLPWMGVYTGLTAVLSPVTGTVFWQGPHIPLLGTLSLGWSGIFTGLVRGLRMWTLLVTVFAFGRLIRMDDITAWLGVRFARTSLTLAMVLSFIPNLQAERQRLLELNLVRGAKLHQGSLRVRTRRMAVIYQTLLQNALERSWLLAESMHVRGYGHNQRSMYRPSIWRPSDTGMLLAGLLLCGLDIGLLWPLSQTLFAHQVSWWVDAYPWFVVGLQITISVWFGGRIHGVR